VIGCGGLSCHHVHAAFLHCGCSFRVKEADAEARLLKAKFAELGITAFVSSADIDTGANWRRVIGRNLDSCRWGWVHQVQLNQSLNHFNYFF
jgi:hypothetical protein